MEDCCGTCWKKLVIAFNIIFLICGLGLLGAGIYFQLTLEGYSAILGNENINPGTLLIIIGGITVIIAFFGCCGAFCENACMLKTFGSLVALLLLIEVILVAVVYFKQSAIKEHMQGTIQEYNNNNATENEGITKMWDTLQQNYECCGVVHPRDWNKSHVLSPKSVPDSCCKEETKGCGENARNKPDNSIIFSQGCYVKLTEDDVLLGTVGGVLLGIQLLAIIISCCMAFRRKDSEDGYELTNIQD